MPTKIEFEDIVKAIVEKQQEKVALKLNYITIAQELDKMNLYSIADKFDQLIDLTQTSRVCK